MKTRETRIVSKRVGYGFVWVKRKDTSYPQLWQEVKLLLLSFLSTYLTEKGFSLVVQLLTKHRNRLDISNVGDPRSTLTNIESDIAS
ncbi:HAT, C-terminal dimerisation domain [Cinara cedri]|uniref:HAT, C-terminal dimerisation domain n=1 Tax=Cinara cedri TaxID=506608 RepID=A0A5E4N6F2_9HEMI|nr:HAT, C-terminal dimerisation domain [Cinara cedri]